MKKFLVLLAAIALAAGFWFAFKPKVPAIPPSNTSNPGSSLPETNSSMPVNGTLGALASGTPGVALAAAAPAMIGSEVPNITNPPAVSLPPLTVLDNARVVIHNYNAAFGENPVGDNSEITAALLGKNPKQIKFISEESGLRVNDKGEMIDAWGTPFFFHQLSAKLMEIRSAGEDKKMWTFDDLITR